MLSDTELERKTTISFKIQQHLCRVSSTNEIKLNLYYFVSLIQFCQRTLNNALLIACQKYKYFLFNAKLYPEDKHQNKFKVHIQIAY